MTNPTTDDQTAARYTNPIRHIVAFVLLAAAGIGLLLYLVDWLWPGQAGLPFTDRSALLLPTDLAGLITVGLPLLAVLIASHVAPVLRQARAITLIALILYGVVALLALVSLVTGVMVQLDRPDARSAVIFLLDRTMRLTLFGVAAFVVLRVFLGMAPKPAAAPAYGGYPQQYTGQPYPPPQPYAQPAAAAPAAQTAQAQAAASQAAYGQQAYGGQQYGYAQQAQQQGYQAAGYPGGYGSQGVAPTSASPASGAPASGAPASGAPASAGTGSSPGGYGPGEQLPEQQTQAVAPQQAPAWPPPPSPAQWPPSPAQWPPSPTSKPSSEQTDDAPSTQVMRPEQHGGNAGG